MMPRNSLSCSMANSSDESKSSTLPASWTMEAAKPRQTSPRSGTASRQSMMYCGDVERIIMEVADAVANAAKDAAFAQAKASLAAIPETSPSVITVQQAASMLESCDEEQLTRSLTVKSRSSSLSTTNSKSSSLNTMEPLVDYEENFNSSLLRNFLKEIEFKSRVRRKPSVLEEARNRQDGSERTQTSQMGGSPTRSASIMTASAQQQSGYVDPEALVHLVGSIGSREVSQIASASPRPKQETPSRFGSFPSLLGACSGSKRDDDSVIVRSCIADSKGLSKAEVDEITCRSGVEQKLPSRVCFYPRSGGLASFNGEQTSLSRFEQRSILGSGILESFCSVFGQSRTTMSSICSENDDDLSRLALGSTSSEAMQEEQRFTWVSFWLCLWGIRPCVVFGVWWNQLLYFILVVSIAIQRLILLFFMDLQVHHLCDVILILGALGCLTSARMLHKCDLFESRELGLSKYAFHCGFESTWHSNASKYLLEAVLTWIFVVCSRIVLNLTISFGVDGVLEQFHVSAVLFHCIDVATFALPAGIFTAMTFCVLHYTSALVLAVDAFSDKLKGGTDHSRLSHEWNILRALLRRASRAMENGFLVLVITAMLMLILCAMDMLLPSSTGQDPLGEILPVFVPICILAVWVSRMFFRAADVTGTCRRMPPLVNALSSAGSQGRFCSYDKHVLVEYIRNSAAGFYIREVMVTAEVALKIVSLGGMAIFTILTKTLTDN